MITNEDRHLTLLVQEALAARKIDPGPLDGLWGAKTAAAFAAFRKSHLFKSDSKPAPVPVHPGDPAWLRVARAELGVAEIAGANDNPRIVEYHQCCTLKATDDETAWCSSFVNWCLFQVGIVGTRNAMARSFLNWGQQLGQPRFGCIVVLRRGAPPSGHVGLLLEWHGSSIRVLGGNQGNRVSEATFPASDVLGYRWPKAA